MDWNWGGRLSSSRKWEADTQEAETGNWGWDVVTVDEPRIEIRELGGSKWGKYNKLSGGDFLKKWLVDVGDSAARGSRGDKVMKGVMGFDS